MTDTQQRGYLCPVCGYPDLERPPVNHMICPCCSTHFGYEDVGHTHTELRAEWVANGMQWWSTVTLPPANWNAAEQVRRVTFRRNIIQGRRASRSTELFDAPLIDEVEPE